MADEVKNGEAPAEAVPEPCCGNCVFFAKQTAIEIGVKESGRCRRYPVQMFPVGGQRGIGAIPVPTMVNAGDWCGEHRDPDEYAAKRDLDLFLPSFLDQMQAIAGGLINGTMVVPLPGSEGGGDQGSGKPN